MKKIYILFLFSLFTLCVFAQTTIIVDTEWTVTNSIWTAGDGSINVDLQIGTQTSQKVQGVTTYFPDAIAKLVVNGDLKDDNQNTISVSAGSTLIVYGNLSLTNSSSKLYGNIVVTGTTTMGNSDILGDANLISLGSVTVGGGAAIDGDVYPIPPATGPAESSPIEDLLDEMNGDSGLADIIESIPEVIEVIIENNTSPSLNVSWDGTDGTDVWSSLGNWLNDNVPSGDYSNVTIQNIQSPYCNVDFKAGNFVLEQESSIEFSGDLFVTGDLTINAGAKMTVGGNLTVLGDIMVTNTIDLPASLIVEGSISGTATVNWTYANDRYFYVGHCISDVSYNNYDAVTANAFNLYQYPSNWSKVTSGVLNGSGNELHGYAVKFAEASNVSVSHVGQLNNGTYSRTLNGNNLLANPYQAYIDVESAGFSLPSEADKTVYTATNASGVLSYATYNSDYNIGVNGGSQYIAPGQGFWIVGTSATDLTLSPSACTHTFESGKGMLKSATQMPNDILRMEIRNDLLSDEIAMVFRAEGQSELVESDSKKRLASGKEVPNLYAFKGGVKLAVGLYPHAIDIGSIPLGYSYDIEGELTIRASNISVFDEVEHVYLIDKVEDVTIDLKESDEYTFMASGGEELDRFELRFEAGLTTDIAATDLTVSDKNVIIYVVQQNAKVKVSDALLKGAQRTIEVYNLAGQLVAQHDLDYSETSFGLPMTNTVYIIKVKVDNSSYQEKVLSL